MPRKEQGWITFQTSDEERRLLEEFCQQSQRTKTEVLREFIRNLGQQNVRDDSLPTKLVETTLPTKKIKNDEQNVPQVKTPSKNHSKSARATSLKELSQRL